MMAFLLLIPLHIVASVLACRAVRRSGNTPFQQKMLNLMIWAIPGLGLLVAYGYTVPAAHNATREHCSLAGTVDEEVPPSLSLGSLAPFDVQQHMAPQNGFPILDWQALARWSDTAASAEEASQAFELGIRTWLLVMTGYCGDRFRLYETEDAFIVSPLENATLIATAAFIASTRRRIHQVLAGVAVFGEHEKSILLVLHNEDAYYDYLAAHYPDDGEFAKSGGCFINAGCPHFVVAMADLSTIEPVIAHEMTHSAVGHLPLPRWLDEGLAVNTEQRLTGVPNLLLTPRELRAKHLEYWGATEMQEFWSGDSFFRMDDGNLLSYELARILVAHLSSDWDRFKAFVTTAQRGDGGATAARDYLGIELGALVCALLEQPATADWEPDPGQWALP